MHLIPVLAVRRIGFVLFFVPFFPSPTTVRVQKFNEPSAEQQFYPVNQQGEIAASSSAELFLKYVQSGIFFIKVLSLFIIQQAF